MRRLTLALFLACVCVIGASAYALAHADAPRMRYPAVVRCRFGAEDSLAHVRMVRYDPAHGVLVYACRHTGY